MTSVMRLSVLGAAAPWFAAVAFVAASATAAAGADEARRWTPDGRKVVFKSGGDMMPHLFRQEQVGPLVGATTWGGLVGIWDYPILIDGGVITMPRGGFFNLDGEWDVENKGTPPDIAVEMTPKDMAAGKDPQLERTVAEALRLLEKNPVHLLKEPAPPVRVKP